MEPCAPGTEDDPPIMYSTLNKQATEQERLLKQKAILKNGQYDNIFELSYVNGAEHWFCNVCQCPVMGRVYQHEIGKRHTQNLAMNNRHLDKPRRDEPEEDPITIDVAPGEPVPPGFEEEIGRVAQIQERLDGFKVGPLIALEYLFELQDYDPSKEPVYLCILCDKRGDPRTVLTHLASYNHISQYLQKHFPTCYRALAPYMTKQYKRNWQVTLQKIAEAIEKKFGRLKPFPIEKDKFEKERMHYLQQISKGKHFSEQSGWTFEELIVHDELTKSHGEEKSYESTASNNWGGSAYIERPFKKRSPSPPVVACPTKKSKSMANKKQLPAYVPVGQNSTKTTTPQARRRSLSSVSSISSSDLSDGEGRGRKAGRSPRRRESPTPRGRPLPYQRRRSPSPRRKSPPKKKGEMPWQNPNYQKQKNEFAEKKMTEKEIEKIKKIEEFRKLARAIENDMHKTLKQHEKNPEKHPQYNDEWKKFWNKRYKELQTQGVDASKHDFKPEWIEFWNKRMIELHSDELRNRKDALRKRLGLPEEINPIKFRIGVGPPIMKENPKENKPNLPMAAQPDQDNEVIIIDDKDDDSKSRSPWEKDVATKVKPRDRRSPSPRSRKRSRSRDRNHRSPVKVRSKSREKYISKRSRSRERHFSKRSRSRDRSHSREVAKVKDYSPARDNSRTKNKRSLSREISRSNDLRNSRERRSHSQDRNSRSRDSRERRDVDRMDYRESSYERDMRGRERVRTVADLPWEREKAVYRSHFEDYYKPPAVMRDATRKPVIMSDIPGMQVVMPEDDDDGEVNIVDVLRILTALEERLGSLGPKVIDLLAQALALEKKEANSSETLLDSDLNCVLFETVKEKLKGQLLAGLVDIMQERAFKKAIKKTATLIHMAGQRKRQRERMLPKIHPVTVPGVGTVDKSAIAKQIATALIMQGKTDVTQAELEYLINAVVGMAEASKGSNKPMTTATFLQQIAGGATSLLSSDKHSEVTGAEDKIIIPSSSKKSNVVELEKLTEPLTPSPGKSSVSNMENLSDLDLQTLLQNFKDLSTDEQHNLINYLKKLETQEPERVERLRKFVSLDPNAKAKEEDRGTTSENKMKDDRQSPFSNRYGSVNPASEDLVRIESDEEDMGDDKEENILEEKEKQPAKVHLDSEDEDYTYEDVVKAVSKNVKDKELEDNMKIVEETMKFETNKAKNEVDLKDAKALISNLMSNFSKGSSNSNTIDLLGLGVATPNPSITSMKTPSNIMTSTADFAKTLSSINVANLASIVNNVKMMSQEEPKERPLNFEPPSPLRSNSGKLNFDPGHLNRVSSPRILDRNDLMGFDDVRRNMGLRRQDPGYDMGGPARGLGGPAPLLGSRENMRLPSFGGPSGLSRESLSSRGPVVPPRDLGMSGSSLGARDRPLMPFSRSTTSFGPNYGNNNNNFPPHEHTQYSGRSNVFDQRSRMDNNSRFGGNLFNNNSRPSGGNYRW